MNVRARKIAPVVGGVTAAATAVGAFVPATQVAVAAPDHAAGATSPLGLAQDGTFESCSAYFGFGKEGAMNSVAFEVSDAEGDDAGDHAVPDDVQVVLVVETDDLEGGTDTIRCTPEEVTEAEWDAWLADMEVFPFSLPAYPGPGRYAYPSVSLSPWIEGYGEVTSVSFEVVGYPTDHTLISPVEPRELFDPFALFAITDEPVAALISEELLEHVVQIVEAGPGVAAAEAIRSAVETCQAFEGDPEDQTFVVDDDLEAAIMELLEYSGFDLDLVGEIPEEIDCYFVLGIPGLVQVSDDLARLATYTEPIVLAGPVQEPTPTTAAPTAPGGAQPVTATPRYTG